MNWSQMLLDEIIVPRMNCNLIIYGETIDGEPFCFEDVFVLQKFNALEITLSYEFPTTNPLEKLHHIMFIEFSFRNKGILYYAFTDLIHTDLKRNIFSLTLKVPHTFNEFQNRRFTRITLNNRIPVNCRVVGVRGTSTHQGGQFSCQIVDISAGGLSFITPTRLFYPLFLQLSFLLPDLNRPFELYGEVVRVIPFGGNMYRAAVEFRHITEEITNIIENYCKRKIDLI
jgi:c-di-GMP-binding flagellar brake protein YcgR